MKSQFEKFIDGLDSDKPDWFVVYANEHELKEFTRAIIDGHNSKSWCRDRLRNDIAERLFGVVRAAYVGGMIELPTAMVI